MNDTRSHLKIRAAADRDEAFLSPGVRVNWDEKDISLSPSCGMMEPFLYKDNERAA